MAYPADVARLGQRGVVWTMRPGVIGVRSCAVNEEDDLSTRDSIWAGYGRFHDRCARREGSIQNRRLRGSESQRDRSRRNLRKDARPSTPALRAEEREPAKTSW